MKTPTNRLLALGIAAILIAAGCSSTTDSTAPAAEQASDSASANEAPGIRLVSPRDGAAIQANPPEDLVILDVRTPEEFADGHLDGAVMIDFYRDDFADQLAELDPDVPYLLYCRSGNRSGQTRSIMEELGFTDVADIDGGVVSWLDAGLPTVSG